MVCPSRHAALERQAWTEEVTEPEENDSAGFQTPDNALASGRNESPACGLLTPPASPAKEKVFAVEMHRSDDHGDRDEDSSDVAKPDESDFARLLCKIQTFLSSDSSRGREDGESKRPHEHGGYNASGLLHEGGDGLNDASELSRDEVVAIHTKILAVVVVVLVFMVSHDIWMGLGAMRGDGCRCKCECASGMD